MADPAPNRAKFLYVYAIPLSAFTNEKSVSYMRLARLI